MLSVIDRTGDRISCSVRPKKGPAPDESQCRDLTRRRAEAGSEIPHSRGVHDSVRFRSACSMRPSATAEIPAPTSMSESLSVDSYGMYAALRAAAPVVWNDEVLGGALRTGARDGLGFSAARA